MFYNILTCGVAFGRYEMVRGIWDNMVSWFKVTPEECRWSMLGVEWRSIISKAIKGKLEGGRLISHSWIGILVSVISSFSVSKLCKWFVAVRVRFVGHRNWFCSEAFFCYGLLCGGKSRKGYGGLDHYLDIGIFNGYENSPVCCYSSPEVS